LDISILDMHLWTKQGPASLDVRQEFRKVFPPYRPAKIKYSLFYTMFYFSRESHQN
jgi:hypothetical protein